MELVYLWVEEYKNIKEQGFNFSPRFRCEYDKDRNELTIEENVDYIPNFFGENINITAIVGKNGSGKSNVIKLIYKLFFLFNYLREITSMEPNNLIDSCLIDTFKCFLIIRYNKKYYKIDSEFIKDRLQKKGLISNKDKFKHYFLKNINNFQGEINFFSIYYSYSLDSWQDKNCYWMGAIYHKADNYKTNLLVEPYKKGDKIDLKLLNRLSNQRILIFYSYLNKELNKKITSFFNPNKIVARYSYAKTLFDDEMINKDGKTLSDSRFINYKVFVKYINLKEIILGEKNFHPVNEIKKSIQKLYDEKKFKEINLLYILFKIIEKKKLFKNIASDMEIFKNIEKLEIKIKALNKEEDFLSFIEELERFINRKIDILVEKLNEEKEDFNFSKILISLKFHKRKLYEQLYKYFDNIDIVFKYVPTDNILEYFPAWLDVDFYENDKSLSSLSTGEKLKFQFLIGMLYQLNNLKNTDYSNIQIYLDEVEFSQHPQWQKNFVNDIIFTISKFKLNFNFSKAISLNFLTHSPFIISDIPKQNIIFLDKNENGNCKVVDGLKEKKQTFGANIHTLLSDSFFMEDGLMGEFAKSKIDELIQYLNGKGNTDIKSDDEAQKLINIIGEPIVKKQLQRMLDSKRLKKIDEIDILKKSIEDMQKRLEELENDKNSK